MCDNESIISVSSLNISDDSSLSFSSDDTINEALLLYLGYNIYISRDSKPANKFVDRNNSWKFVLSWSDEMFFRQFRISKNNFSDLAFQMKNNFDGPYDNCWKNYQLSIIRGDAGNFGASIKLELNYALLCVYWLVKYFYNLLKII